MARLAVVNGPPGVGKSTIAARYVADHRLALNLDIDRVRGMLGGWRDDATRAGLLAREVAVAAAGTHLAAGFDVVVPQFVARPEFLDRLRRVAADADAGYVEVALRADTDEVVRRFQVRTAMSTDPVHRDAAEHLERSGGTAGLAALCEQLWTVVAARPWCRIVDAPDGGIAATHAAVLAVLGDAGEVRDGR